VLVKGHAGESPAVRTALAPTAERTFRLRPGFIDIQPSAIDLHSVQSRDGAVRIRVAAHLDKREALACPVSRSVTMFTRSTAPYVSKSERMELSVAE